MKRTLFLLSLISIVTACTKKEAGSNTNSTDTTNQTVTIGTQVWRKKNLDVTTYRNGDPIPQVTDSAQWVNLKTGAWCYYRNDPSTGTIYGKLYNWYAVNDPRGLAPAGWHIPSDDEWFVLKNFLGNFAGGKMKTTGTSLWASPNTGATNSSGWSGLPAGRRFSGGSFIEIGFFGTWWSSTENSATNSNTWHLGYNNDNLLIDFGSKKESGLSIRCIRD
jgi:uncharacterized protein (TIGR02145 family)